MVVISEALTVAAPYFNLVLVLIVVYLFIKLFRTRPASSDIYVKPWYFLFSAIVVYIVEEVTTVLRAADLLKVDVYINGYFELIIISLVIYTLLLQQEHIKEPHHLSAGAGIRRQKRK